MALELVGGAFLSASLQVLFDRLASSEGLNFIRGQKLSASLLSKFKIKLLIVDSVLNHAEVKQFTDPAVKAWLDHAKDAVYDAEDLLEEIATEALRCKMEAADHSQIGSAQVWNSISTWVKAPFSDHQSSIESRVKEMTSKLEVLAEAIDKLGLKPGDGEKLPPRSPSTSLVDESCVFGRDEIKEEMIKRLLSDNVSTSKIDVISIVGMGGAGKTTLAQLLYNDARVKERFDLKAWVCVSEEFLLVRVTKLILEEIGSETTSDSPNLLQLKLRESLADKRFLLVLDDVWEKGCMVWDRLQTPLLAAGCGSKVVVTTRQRNVATVMHAVHTHHLGELCPQDCWSLFTKHAFENGDSTSYPQLESIGKKIVAKCQGLPLAVKALGSLLYSKAEKREWEKILESEIWGLRNHEILPSLILSYHDLPFHLKRCFAYCSIFPKDHEFDKKNLILLWMAEGLLQFSQGSKRMEEVGDFYFHELLYKSFFQKSVTKERCFVMHDLIHDLAQHISPGFCVRLEDDKVQEIFENTRHLFHFKSDSERIVAFNRFEALIKVKCLRTFLELVQSGSYHKLSKRVLQDVLLKMRYLRVLTIYGYTITDLPDSIDKLKYLRYLNISFTKIIKLPESVCNLYNLQTMILSKCENLIELPSRIEKLINLRYLDISDANGLREMPSHVGQLKSLQELSDFIVGQKSGLRISELGELPDIGGRLKISKMENVECAKEALQANMKDKMHLDKLVLKWGYGTSNGIIDDILNNLQPHPNIKQLTIKGYPGVAFPNWVGDPSFFNIVVLELKNCNNCSSLPPFGQLPSLKHLYISKMEGVERLGSEFYHHGNTSASSSITIKRPSFPSLQTLKFEHMDKWEKWLCYPCRRGEFPRLQELSIKQCPKLTGKLPKQLRCLKKLVIDECPQLLVASLKVPVVSELRMKNFGKLQVKRPASDFTALQSSEIAISDVSQWKQLPVGLHDNLEITKCDAVESLLEEGILQTNMLYLRIDGCRFSRSLQKGDFSTTLKSLDIINSSKLEFLLPELLGCHLPFLEHFCIRNSFCDSLSLSFSLGIFPRLTTLTIDFLKGLEFLTISMSEGEPASLNYLNIGRCPNLVYIELPSLGSACYAIYKCWKLKLLAHTLSSLGTLHLSDCPELLFQKGGLPSNLRQLQIWNCDKLTPQVDWGLQRLTSLTHFKILGGCDDMESFPEDCLLPFTLTSLEISGLSKLKSLNSKGLQQLTSLKALSISSCPELQFFGGEGLQHLTSLSKLSIKWCPKLQFIPEEGSQYFPSLKEFEILNCPELQFSTGPVSQHLTSLRELRIYEWPRLQFFTGLQHLISLKYLQIRCCSTLQTLTQVGLQHLATLKILSIHDCPKLQYLTKERLPDSLSHLSICNCPLLEQRCQFGKGQEWCYISHISQIFINEVPI